MDSNISLKFGALSVTHTVTAKVAGDRISQYGSLHRLTPEQFDALIEQFEVTDNVRTLTTDGRYDAPRTFRTAEIDFGGLHLTLFANVPAEAVDPDQLSLT